MELLASAFYIFKVSCIKPHTHFELNIPAGKHDTVSIDVDLGGQVLDALARYQRKGTHDK